MNSNDLPEVSLRAVKMPPNLLQLFGRRLGRLLKSVLVDCRWLAMVILCGIGWTLYCSLLVGSLTYFAYLTASWVLQ